MVEIIKKELTPLQASVFKVQQLVEACGYITDGFLYPDKIYRFFINKKISIFLREMTITPLGHFNVDHDLETVKMSGKIKHIIPIAEKLELHGFKVIVEVD